MLAGTLIGAGMVTTHLLLQHPTAAVVPAGSEIVFSLTEPMDLIRLEIQPKQTAMLRKRGVPISSPLFHWHL